MNNSQIITCSGLDCSVCSLLEIFQNMFNWLLSVSAVVAVLSVTLAGLLYIFSIGEKELLLKAKKFSTFAITGLVFVLTSFLLINAIFFIFGFTNAGNWFQFDCSEDFIKTSIQESQKEGPRTANINYEFLPASNIFPSASNPNRVTSLDVSGLSPESLLSDSLALQPGQRIRFVATDKSLSESDLKNYINAEKGYFVAGSGDRTEGTGIENLISIVRTQDGVMVVLEGEEPQILGELKNDSNASGKTKNLFNQVIQLLASKEQAGGNVYVFNDKNQEEDAAFDALACEESGGSVTVFQSECAALKEACGQSTILCSDKEDEIMGCQCPAGTCLKNQKCMKIENLGEFYDETNQDDDGVADKIDQCPNTPAGEVVNKDKTSSDYGCACSQLKLNGMTCPPSRCEGEYLVIYPPLGQDTCSNGKRTKYACEPKRELNSQCQQAMNQASPITLPPISSNIGSQPTSSSSSSSGSSGSPTGGGSGQTGGGGKPSGGCDSCGRGGNTTGTSSPSPSPSTSVSPPLSAKEAFESGNGSPADPFVLSDKAIKEIYNYNEDTGKIELDKNWDSKLGLVGKDVNVKVPDKKKIVKNVNEKRKEKGKKELTDEQKEKLEKDEDSVKAPKDTRVVDKDGKEQKVDKGSDGQDPSKIKDDSLNEDQILRPRITKGTTDYDEKDSLTRLAKKNGLVKLNDAFTKTAYNNYFQPELADRFGVMSDYLKDRGYGMNMVSGFRPGAIIEGTNTYSNHAFASAADIRLTDLEGRDLPVNSQTVAMIKEAAAYSGLHVISNAYDWGRHVELPKNMLNSVRANWKV